MGLQPVAPCRRLSGWAREELAINQISLWRGPKIANEAKLLILWMKRMQSTVAKSTEGGGLWEVDEETSHDKWIWQVVTSSSGSSLRQLWWRDYFPAGDSLGQSVRGKVRVGSHEVHVCMCTHCTHVHRSYVHRLWSPPAPGTWDASFISCMRENWPKINYTLQLQPCVISTNPSIRLTVDFLTKYILMLIYLMCIHEFEGILPIRFGLDSNTEHKSSIDCLLEEMQLFVSFPVKATSVATHSESLYTIAIRTVSLSYNRVTENWLQVTLE